MASPKPFSINPTELQQKIVDYLLSDKPRLYKQKKKCGELQSYLDLITKKVTKTAENLIKRGMFENEAWKFAIRHEISLTENK